MTETEEMLTDWKAVYGELNPGRDPDRMRYDEAMLAGFTLLRREIRMAKSALPDQSRSFTPRGRIIHRLSQFDLYFLHFS